MHRIEYDRARELLQESLDLHRSLGDLHSVAITLNNIGNVEHLRGRLDDAESFYRESLAAIEDLEGRAIASHVFLNLGDLARDRGEHARARQLYADALAVTREVGQRREAANTLASLAALEVAIGRMERAARLLGAAARANELNRNRLMPDERRSFETTTARARDALGRETFEREQAAGRAMALEDAIAYALEEPAGGGVGDPTGFHA